MKEFLLMLSFFTRLPVPTVEFTEERYRRGLVWVPFIGLIMGLLLYAVSFLHLVLDPAMVALALIAVWLILSGALHLDGLADSFDGLFSGRDRERILSIMHDSHIGTFGVIGLIFYFCFSLIILQRIPFEALIVSPIIGKSAPVLSAYLSHYARAEGMGKIFTDNCGKKELTVALILPVLISAALNPWFLPCVVLALLIVVPLTRWTDKAIGGITGDTMGMVCELSQMAFLLATAIVKII